MKRLLLAAFVLAGCSDGALRPDVDESLSIMIGADRLPEATLVVGEVLQLGALLDGRPAPGGTAVGWVSRDPAVVSVDGAGLARGEGAGSARIVATLGAAADSILLTVLPSMPPAASCDEGGLAMYPGQVITTTAAAAARFCLDGGGEGAEFLVVPFHASASSGSLAVEVTGQGLAAPRAQDLASLALPSLAWTPAERERDRAEIEFDRRLREREARDLGPLVRSRSALDVPPQLSPASVPAVGGTMRLNVNSGASCTSPIYRDARVAAVTDRAIVLHDTANPAGGFTDAEYRDLGMAFDRLVYPTVTGAFGEPTDIDGNGRVLILFTRAVNEMTDVNANSFIAGFFYSRDLFPRSDTPELRACPGSNVAEILYMLVPDPEGTVNGNRRSKQAVQSRTAGVLAHELQHLVNASRRLRVVRAQQWNEEFWLNEGLSHVAEELAFFAATSFEARQSISIEDLRRTPEGVNRFNEYQSSNFARMAEFLRRPDTSSPLQGTDLAARGAAWSFLRYAADRRTGPENQLWSRMVDSHEIGLANLSTALGSSALDWMNDWTVSLYLDDLGIPTSSRFRQPSWNHRSIMAAFENNHGRYPLVTSTLQSGATTRLSLRQGGSAFLRFAVAPGDVGEIATTSGGAAPPERLRISIARTR
jgi:hypothetical protein